MYLFFDYMYTGGILLFYTVVYVNNVTLSLQHWMIHTDRRETLLFYKKENLFILYISMCFYTKKGKKNNSVRGCPLS